MTNEQKRLLGRLRLLDGTHAKHCGLVRDKTVRECFDDGDFNFIGYQLIGGIRRPLGQCRYCHAIQPLDVFDDPRYVAEPAQEDTH